MDGKIVAEGAEVSVSQDWAEYLDQFKDIAGSVLAVFFVVLVIVLVAWLGVAAFTHLGKTQAAKRIFGILTTAALAGCLVSTLGWSVKSMEEGGAGFGSVSTSGGEQVDVEADGHSPKQWSMEDVQSDSSEDDEEETSEPTPTEEPPPEDPTTEPPGGGKAPPEEGNCIVLDGQSNLVKAAALDPCKDR